MGYIYKITNILTKKCYIGQTINDLENRWRDHKKSSSNCIYLKRAFNKYGLENFKFELIIICFDEDLNKYEIEYIDKFNSIVPNGYNLKGGGKNGGKHHQETKDKIRNSLKTFYNFLLIKNHNCEICDKIIKGGHNKTCSKECYLLINSRKVFKYDLKNNLLSKYNSCKEAGECNNVTTAGISMVCNNKRTQLKGFIYKFC